MHSKLLPGILALATIVTALPTLINRDPNLLTFQCAAPTGYDFCCILGSDGGVSGCISGKNSRLSHVNAYYAIYIPLRLLEVVRLTLTLTAAPVTTASGAAAFSCGPDSIPEKYSIALCCAPVRYYHPLFENRSSSLIQFHSPVNF
jgi:hypothetical protein